MCVHMSLQWVCDSPEAGAEDVFRNPEASHPRSASLTTSLRTGFSVAQRPFRKRVRFPPPHPKAAGITLGCLQSFLSLTN